MGRTREDKRCFSEKEKKSQAAKMSCVQILCKKKEMMSANNSQALYLHMLDMTGMLNVDAT